MKTILSVNGMMCEHCVKRVTKAAMGIPAVASVSVDLQAKTVEIEHNNADIDAVKAAINDLGFEVAA